MSFKTILMFVALMVFYGVRICSGQSNSTEEVCKGWNTAPIVEVWKEPLISKKLAGTIITNVNQAIEGVTVIITDKNYKHVLSFVKTTKDGKFSFRTAKYKDYHILICKSGYRPIRMVISLKPKSKNAPELNELTLSVSS